MRILIDLQACQATNQHRGIGRYSMSLAQSIARQGGNHDLKVLLNRQFPESIEPIRKAFGGLLHEDDIVVFDGPSGIAEIHAPGSWRCKSAEQIREFFIRRFSPDIVHVSSLFEGLVDDAVTSVRHLPNNFASAVTLYDLIPLLRKETYLSDPRVRQWYYRKLQGLKSAELLLAISEHSRTEALDWLHLPSDRVVNISSAIDDSFRPLALNAEEAAGLKAKFGIQRPFVMYTGGIDPRKNIEGLIKAFARLPLSLRSAYQLAIVCKISDADLRRLQALAGSAGLQQDEVVFTDYVSDEELLRLYNLCTLFVFPSLHEGFGLPALEAMACGVAVIGSNVSSIPEVIGREDALFKPDDLEAMSAKMEQALIDPAFRQSLQSHGLEQCRKFSWKESGYRALQAFEELHERRQPVRPSVPTGRRPRLAYVSPLPPGKSGIADYSAELLPELARYYEIELIVNQEHVDDAWVAANFVQRPVSWFQSHADKFDRIVYHFGNSSFHEHMFKLLPEHPGVVVLHDFFLSGILHYLEATSYLPGAFRNALYYSHGYPALIDAAASGKEAAAWQYPGNRQVLDHATGLIIHSDFSRQLAKKWYGEDEFSNWKVIPLIRAVSKEVNREQARQQLGIGDDDFLICSFGLLGKTKLNHRLLNSWLNSVLARNKNCLLVFVGENDPNQYGRDLAANIAKSPASDRIRITGFASPELYRTYLAAADAAVQLRTLSRGETSASILDCLAHGIPTIINRNGSASELPDEVLVKLPDEFTDSELTSAIEQLHGDGNLREAMATKAVSHVLNQHHPARVGQMYFEAIEAFALNSSAALHHQLINAISEIPAPVSPAQDDLIAIAGSIARNRETPRRKQLLVDISELVQRDAKSGIQRVVRNVLQFMLRRTSSAYRVEPVYDAGGYYAYARNFTCGMLNIAPVPMDDEAIEANAGDIFLGLDLNPQLVPNNRKLFEDMKNRGIGLHFVVYDLLPILRPDVFVDGAKSGFTRWLECVATLADGLVCISRAVADEVHAWVETTQLKRTTPLQLGYFHLGADINAAAPAIHPEEHENLVPEQIGKHASLLMVGTLEPRKGHAQALAAFELLWKNGEQANLVIVGKQGWMVEPLVEKLRTHPEIGKRLFWFENASDTLLLRLYEAASGLLAASEAEGFGLPLVEAAQYKLPIVARDLPVFREVAGNHAYYFKGDDSADLAEALKIWLEMLDVGQVPTSENMPWLTWEQSTKQLLDAVENSNWYKTVPVR
ncbi:glycosyltransferase [Noviherbaspirillum malthae]|uniref:glycosyltransferase n=1 Tax=Noviherbaspirillum malthae TaxID=1260987 RepID=UPI00188F222F|nr:glycosyltransferase [Noviherbaspirillum malthae]